MLKNLLSTKNEIKFAVEAMTQCGASCSGCFLTPELRQSQDFWKKESFSNAKQFIINSINNLSSKQTIDEIAINMGQGDYFQLNELQIRQVIDFVYECGNGKASAFITASGITNSTKLKKAVDYFYQYSIEREQALLIDFVLDASSISSDKMFSIYSENLSYIREKFGHVDVNLNISADTINNTSPEEINNFMIQNELKFLVINVVPAEHNKVPLQKSWSNIVLWLTRLYNIWNKDDYELNYANSIKSLQMAFPADKSIHKIMNDGIKEVMMKEYVIDNNGNIFFQQAGFGDLPLSNRNGYEPIGHINDKFNYHALEKHAQKVCVSIIRKQSQEPCSNCCYKNICASSGMHVLNSILNNAGTLFKSKSFCPIDIKNLYEKISSSDKNTIKGNSDFAGIYAQKGLENNKIRLEKMTYSDKYIKIEK